MPCSGSVESSSGKTICYLGDDGIETFSGTKLAGALKQEAKQPNSAVAS